VEGMELWTSHFDNHNAYDCIYLDFAKAFDKVPHKRLVAKLESIGINGKLLRWIEDFLKNRNQIVVIKDTHSETKPVTSGIPQGSVLGPILFIVFINDLPDTVESNLKIFADDTKIFRLINNINDKELLQRDLDKILEWSSTWQMPFNIDKCKVIHYGGNNQNYDYTLNDQPLTPDNTEKDLGVLFDKELKFTHHISQIVSKANSRLGLIKSMFQNLDSSILLPLYKSLVRPLLEYCVSVWNPTLKMNINEIEKVQRRATKLIKEIKHLDYPSRLKYLKLDSLLFRRRRQDMIQVYRIFNKIDNLDPYIFFTLSESANTRGHPLKINKPRAQTNLRLHSFSRRTINDWNKLDRNTVLSTSINSFKTALRKEWANHPDKYFD
jgi:hypothetical protein